jgi:chromosome segregation ATPase
LTSSEQSLDQLDDNLRDTTDRVENVNNRIETIRSRVDSLKTLAEQLKHNATAIKELDVSGNCRISKFNNNVSHCNGSTFSRRLLAFVVLSVVLENLKAARLLRMTTVSFRYPWIGSASSK